MFNFESKSMTILILRTFSRLPYLALHGAAKGLAWFARVVLGYRKKVIQQNLKNSFPDANAQWLKKVERRYYGHFADITVESIKHFTITDAMARSRMKHRNVELFERYFDEGRSVLIAGGHLNNWELYAMSANQSLPHDVMAVYKKLSEEKMDDAVRESRERFGLKMVRTIEAQEWMEQNIFSQPPKAVVMGFDQSPADPKKSYWTPFLNQETAWYFGLEKWSREFNLPVIYGHIYKLRKGHYETTYELVIDDPKSAEKGEILKRCINLLEQDIRKYPSQWLWSHKRWKHQRPSDMPLNEVIRLDQSSVRS